MCIAMWGAYAKAYFTGMHVAIGRKQDSPVPVHVKPPLRRRFNELIKAKQRRTK